MKGKADYWDVVRVKCAATGAHLWLTLENDKLDRAEARTLALGTFLHGHTESVYIESRSTNERVDLTQEMQKVEAEYNRRRGDAIFAAPIARAELEDIIRMALPGAS